MPTPLTKSTNIKPSPISRDERYAMGARWRETAKQALKMADRLDPEHANVCLIEVNSMGQVAKVITGLKNVLDAKQKELDTSVTALASVKADAVVAINAAEADKQALQGQITTLNASLATANKTLADSHVLDAEDEQAIADALPLVDGLDVATVVIN